MLSDDVSLASGEQWRTYSDGDSEDNSSNYDNSNDELFKSLKYKSF